MKSPALNSLERLLKVSERALIVVAGSMLVAMMFVTTADVVMRYFFNSPLNWAYDLVLNYLMTGVFFFSFSSALTKNMHVSLDYFSIRFHQKTRKAGVLVAWIACFILLSIISLVAFRKTIVAWTENEVMTGVIAWPLWVQYAIPMIGMTVLGLRLIAIIIKELQLNNDGVYTEESGAGE